MRDDLPENCALDFYNVFDTENPRSLVNILPGAVATKLAVIPGELYELDVLTLKKKCLPEPNDTRAAVDEYELEMLRTAWWYEYTRSQKTETKFLLSNVYNGICFQNKFMKRYMGNSFRLLYLITPPVDYQIQQHHILQKAFEFERRVLEMPEDKAVYNKEGEMVGEEKDTKLLAIKQKISEAVKNRVQGMPVARSMQINQNMNTTTIHNMGSSGAPSPTKEMDESELEKIVNDLKVEQGILPEGNAPVIKDVNVAEKYKED